MQTPKKRRIDDTSREELLRLIELSCGSSCSECPVFQRCMIEYEFDDMSCPETICAYLFEEVDADAQG